MKFSELTPEEKLVCAIFGKPSWVEGVRHFLTDDGREAVNDMLAEVVANHHNRPLPHLHVQPASRTFCERGVKVLRLRYGFEPRTDAEKVKHHSCYGRTIDEVKVYFGVTRGRIMQIEAKMLRMLRHPVNGRKIRAYLDGVRWSSL